MLQICFPHKLTMKHFPKFLLILLRSENGLVTKFHSANSRCANRSRHISSKVKFTKRPTRNEMSPDDPRMIENCKRDL